MPLSKVDIQAIPMHVQRVRLENGNGLITPDEATNSICNDVWVLPQPKLDAEVMHLPCMWAGDDGHDDPIHPDDRREHQRKRFGWSRVGIKYLLILPYPTVSDAHELVALSANSLSGSLMRAELQAAGIDLADVVVTYVARFPLPAYQKAYDQKNKSSCAPLLRADIQRLKPEVIIAVGADALKVMFGLKTKLDTYRGDVLDYTIGGHTSKVVLTVSHFQFISDKANISVFQSELRRAAAIGQHVWVQPARHTDYRLCTSVADVAKLCDDIRAAAPPYIAFDTEWGNDVQRNEFRYTLSIQLAWGKGKAAFVQLRTQTAVPELVEDVPAGKPRKDGTCKTKRRVTPAYIQGGVPMHSADDEHQIWFMLQQLLLDTRWRLVGHHLRVDVEEFHRAKCPIDARVADGIDTMLIHHLLYGDEDQGLDHLARKYLPSFAAYWKQLEEWLDAHDRNVRLAFGYRDIPLDILIPYGQADADATWQLVEPLMSELAEQPGLFRLYTTHVAPTSLHLLDVERHGILVDEDQRMLLRDTYQPVYDEVLTELRDLVDWQDFNPNSDHHKRALLFSTTTYKGKKAAPTGARVLALKPLYNTDKYPRAWDDIVRCDEERVHAPATKAKFIDLMAQLYPEVRPLKLLRTLSVLGTFLKSYLELREPNGHLDATGHAVLLDGKGFHNNIDKHGRVHTHLSQITETGRYTSSRANLQTKPKRQEAAALACLVYHKYGCTLQEYKKRCDHRYTGADALVPADQLIVNEFAECFIAPPGYCLIEADFKTAELFIWAYCSGDPALIKICDGGRDLHSEVAAFAFKLEPEKARAAIDAHAAGNREAYNEWAEWFKLKYGAERTAAKACNFGIMYGRGAGALAREIMGQGVSIDEAGAQTIINQVAADFPVAWKWLEQNAKRAIEHERLENAFGRVRYFTGSRTMFRSDQNKVGREAKNFDIQSAVADLLAQAGIMLYQVLKRRGPAQLDMKILLPVHDAFLFEVKNEHVPEALKIIKMCMSDLNTLPGLAYHLGVDIEIHPKNWGDDGYKASKVDKFMADHVYDRPAVSAH